ncbi:MAG: carbohydrate ABC transporter permease [Candidatus Caldatribacteriaceae bacterium]
MTKMRRQKRFFLVIASLLLLFWVFFPVYWVLKTSFAPEEEVWGMGLPRHPTLQNFRDIFTVRRGSMVEVTGAMLSISPTIVTPLGNTLFVAILAVFLTMMVSSIAAFNLSRFSYRGKRVVSSYILFAYVFPPFILMVPITVVMRRLGLYDSLWGLTLAHLAYTIPFATYMLRGYFLGIPQELEEAAQVDGCSRFQSFVRITLPLAAPGLVTVAIFSFVLSWGDVVFATVLLNTQDQYTLPIHIGFFLWGGEIVDPGRLAATALVAGLIPAFLYIAIQRFVQMGLVAGAVKG